MEIETQPRDASRNPIMDEWESHGVFWRVRWDGSIWQRYQAEGSEWFRHDCHPAIGRRLARQVQVLMAMKSDSVGGADEDRDDSMGRV